MPVTEGMLRGVFQGMSAMPTGATQLPPGQPARLNIPIPDTALEVTEMLTRTLSLEWLGKDVRFFNPDLLPQPLRASLQAPGQVIRQAISLPFVRQFLELVVPGTKGDLGQLAASFQTPVGTPVPVSFEWRWSVKDAAGATLSADQGHFLSPGGLTVPQTSFLLPPPVRKAELKDYSLTKYEVQGGVKLEAGAIDTGWLDFPPIPFFIEPLQIPTILALFVNRNFQTYAEDTPGAVLVVVPEGSDLVGLGPYLQALTAAATAIRSLGSLLSLLPLGATASTVTSAINAFGGGAQLAAQDDISNLNDWTLIQREWYENDTEAEDEISSLILVGVPGTTVRLYNARSFGTNEGVLQVSTGPEGYALIRNLDAATPVTEPPGRATAVVPSPWNSFRDTFSSLRFTA
jgi:hypothetical protein